MPATPLHLVGAAHRVWIRHPRWSLAVKGAVAAALAWVVGVVAPEPLSEYPYYAPLGAVVATTSSVVRSVRESVQAVAALLLGVAVARAADVALAPGALSVALVVGVALLCSGWRVFGGMGVWAPMSALFVLILGDVDALEYVGSFSGLVVVGAAIGIGVNLVLPPLPLTPSERALDRLRDVLVDQVGELADAVGGGEPLDTDEWERRRRALHPTIEQAREAVAWTREATRANPRVRLHRDRAALQGRRAAELGTCATVVDDVVRLLVEHEWSWPDREVLGPELRRPFAVALRRLVDALRPPEDGDEDGDDDGHRRAADRYAGAVDRLRDAVCADGGASTQAGFVAGALVLAMQRAAGELTAR